ncbi:MULTISPECIES: ExbD/TolR family protein [Vitreoscilla]|uniref:Biopolymer transporter ExbD n=1 Tax=Vitreoscilla stercoraria TaxID=61 RepID=A0ABY4E989_VITST|nr:MULTISPECIES: biopolymer transporter ExbD [Vitreoscilla]AUZ06408.1 biopolymer transport protein ExbD/TolR [Vitreoscilla sp. C1]UOO92306.1 biopolymer transporter ExbD [Vitreoscilla stercoraria]
MSFGSMNDGGNDSPMAEINVTPLVDVMLVLLIVFMVTMPVLTHQIPLNLPTASENAKEQPVKEQKEPFRMDIRVDGTYHVDGKEITADKLVQELKVQLEKDPDTVLAIAADKASEHEALTTLLAAAQEVGLTKVGFVTETPAVLTAQ